MKRSTVGIVLACSMVALILGSCDQTQVASAGYVGFRTQSSTTSPVVTLTANGLANALIVPAGTPVQLAWASQNASVCSVSLQVGPSGAPTQQSWGNTLNGTYALTPTDENIVIATCVDNLGQTAESKVDIMVQAPCTGAGKTLVQLLTRTIVNRAANQYMKYTLSYQDCAGNPAPIPNTPIWYDDDARESTDVNPLSYWVTAADGTVSAQGTLQTVWGQDLFGHQGSDYFHFVTDHAVNLPAGTTSCELTIDMSNTVWHAFSTVLFFVPAQEVIDTFLSFGNSQPDVAPVTFLNN